MQKLREVEVEPALPAKSLSAGSHLIPSLPFVPSVSYQARPLTHGLIDAEYFGQASLKNNVLKYLTFSRCFNSVSGRPQHENGKYRRSMLHTASDTTHRRITPMNSHLYCLSMLYPSLSWVHVLLQCYIISRANRLHCINTTKMALCHNLTFAEGYFIQ